MCEDEDTDRSPVEQMSWYKVVPNRPFGQKTNLLSQYHQGFGIVTRYRDCVEGATKDQTWEVRMCTDSRALVTEGGSWTQLTADVWEGCWKYEIRREGVHIGPP